MHSYTDKRRPARRQAKRRHSWRKGYLQFAGISLVSHPEAAIVAVMDPRLVGVIQRIAKGQHDCALCRATLELDPDMGDDALGVVGFLHGDVGDDVGAIGVAVCCACTRALGDDGVGRALSLSFAAEFCGGGEILEVAQGGTA